MTEKTVYRAARVPRISQPVVRGLRHRVLEWGNADAEPVFFLHGWGDTAATFQFVVDAFDGDRRVVAHDWRGFGESQWAGSLYWFPDYLADLDAFLNLYSPERPAVLVGHSMGANVAALYAGARPERVRGFVNIEGFGLPDSHPDDMPAHYARWLSRIAEGSDFATYGDFDALAERVRKRSPRTGLRESRFVAREWAREESPGNVRLKADPAHRLPNAVMYRRAEAEACWRAISAKVLLVSGKETGFREALADWLQADSRKRPFPGAELEVIDEAGHMLHFEAPARLAAIIERFLDDL